MSPCEYRFDRQGFRFDFACSQSLAQPGTGMFRPITVIELTNDTSGLIYSLAEVNFAFFEAVQVVHVGA